MYNEYMKILNAGTMIEEVYYSCSDNEECYVLFEDDFYRLSVDFVMTECLDEEQLEEMGVDGYFVEKMNPEEVAAMYARIAKKLLRKIRSN